MKSRLDRSLVGIIDIFIEVPTLHLTDYALLSPSLKNKISDEIKYAKDDQKEALDHTGVPAIEAAINEYLDKYAVTSKITNTVNSFLKIVEREQMMQNIQKQLSEDEDERNRVYQEMSRINQELQQGEKARVFKKKIKNLDFNIYKYFEEIKSGIFNIQLQSISDKFRTEMVRKHEADNLLK